MSSGSSTASRKWLALAGLAAVPLAAFALLRWQKARGGQHRTRAVPASPNDWTSADVLQWLRTLQLSPEALEAFRASGVDGQTLQLLREEHLREMGVTKVGDKLKVTAGLQALFGGAAAPAATAQAPKRQSPAKHAEGASQASPQMKAVARLQGIFSVLGSDQFKTAPRDAQVEVLSESEAELSRIMPVLQNFPGDQKTTILAAAESLQQRIAAAKRGLQLGRDAQSGGDRKQESNWADVVQGIRDSLSSLNTVINSPEAHAGSPEQREMLLKAVLSQLSKVSEVCEQLPDAASADVRQLVQRTEAAAFARLGKPQSRRAAPEGTGLQQPVARLREIFDALKELPQRATSESEFRHGLHQLRGDVEQVKSGLHSEPNLQPEEKRMILEMAEQILSAVSKTEEMMSLGAAGEETTHSHTHGHHGHHHGHHHRHGTESVEEVPTYGAPELMAKLNNIVLALQSSSDKNPQDQLRELERLHTGLQLLEPSLQALPANDRQDVEPIFSKLKQYFDLLLAEKEHPSRATPRLSPRALQREATAAQERLNVQSVVRGMQSLYGSFNSQDFLGAPPSEQLRRITAAEHQLKEYQAAIAGFRQEDREALEPLRASLEEMVLGLHAALNSELGPSARESRHMAPKRSPSKADAPQVSPRAALREVFETLSSMRELLRSDEAKSASRVERHKLAQSVLAQVEKALSFGRSIGGAQEEELQRFCSAVVEDARALMTERQHDSKEAEVTAEVLATLRGMAALISSENFRQQSPSRRGAIAANLHARIQEMKPVVANLPPAQREVLDEQLELVDSVLRAARSSGSSEPAAGPAQTPASEVAAVVTQRLKHLFSVISSTEFQNADPSNQRELLDLVEQQLVTLAKECSELPQGLRAELYKGIEQLEGVVRTLRTRAAPASTQAGGSDLFRRAAAATEVMESGQITSTDQLKPLMEILEELDAAPMRTEANLQVRKAFQRALSRTIDSLTQAGGGDGGEGEDDEGENDEEEEGEDENEEQNDEEASPRGDEELDRDLTVAARQATRDATQDVQGFVADLVSLAQAVRAGGQDPEQLSETMTQLEQMLARASASGIAWQSSPQIVELVRTILGNIQGAQEEVNEENAVNTERTIREATQQLRAAASTLTSVEELTPWLRLLDSLSEMQDSLGVRELRALQEYQQEILHCSRQIRDQAAADVGSFGQTAEGSTTTAPLSRKHTSGPRSPPDPDPEEAAE